MEFTAVESATVHPDGVTLQLPQSVKQLSAAADTAGKASESGGVLRAAVTGKMLIDCMGHFSPIVRQV